MLLMARALWAVGSDGVLMPSAYPTGERRMRSEPALPQVVCVRLLPTPLIGSTADGWTRSSSRSSRNCDRRIGVAGGRALRLMGFMDAPMRRRDRGWVAYTGGSGAEWPGPSRPHWRPV